MAERRMFAKTIIDSDAFLDMPLSAQALYFHLSMRADDDGFINNPKKIQRFIGGSEDDLKLLVAKRFIIPFESGIVVIKHWRIHNYIQKDRYKPTVYQEEMTRLKLKENNAYTLDTDGIQDGYSLEAQVRLGKDSIELGKDSIELGEVNNSALSTKDKTTVQEALAEVAPLILNDGTEWNLSLADYNEYVRCYPAVDIIQQFNQMRAWCINNPTKRKTSRGVKRFIGNWLSKEQNKGTKPSYRGTAEDLQNKYINRLDIVDEWAKGDA